MASSRRFRFRDQETEGDSMADEVETEGSSGSGSDHGYESELHSMTGKGIKRLCSELLELKKSSDEDFQRNVYSNYPAFIRILEEAGSVESDLMELKHHVSTQSKLINDLMNSLNLEILSDSTRNKAERTEYLDPLSPKIFGTDMYDTLDTLDILLSEHQLEEALVVLEVETKTLQTMHKEDLSPMVMSYMYSISDRRDRLADQFACLAKHPRVCQPEMIKALCGLCRLGEKQRANFLLFKYFHSCLANYVKELECSKPDLHGIYMRELAKIVFSVISQAAGSFIMLHGEASPYSSELIQWAKEEIKVFGGKFDKYIRSISELTGGLFLTDLMKLIRPCMEEVLLMHMDYFKKVVRIWTTTDTWLLGKFFLSGKLRNKTSQTGIEYRLLSSSGRKFVTLMQEIVDDISSLVNLHMESSILQGLAELFNEYMHALQRAIPNREHAGENGFLRISSAQELMQQLPLLVNSLTLVDLFPVIAASVSKDARPSNDGVFLEHADHFSQEEIDTLILSVQEAAEQLWCHFCHQFVSEVMSTGKRESSTSLEPCANGQQIPTSTQDQMPSFAFQALFLQLRKLEDLSKSIFIDKDGLVDKLLKELMKAVIVWLSDNQEFWENTEMCSHARKLSFVEQVRLDIHFLVEIAQFRGYCSDDLMAAAVNTLVQIGATSDEFESNSDRWASNAAKLAIEKLLAVHEAELQPKEEAATIFLGDLSTQKWEDASPSDEDDAIGIPEDSADVQDGEFDGLAEEDITKLLHNRSSVLKPLKIPTSDAAIVDLDDEGSRGHKNEDDAIGTSSDAVDLLDGEFNGLAEEHITNLLRSLELKPLEIPMRDAGAVDLDGGGSRCHENGDDAIGTSEDSTDLLDGEFNVLAEEDSDKTLVNKIFESKSLGSSINAESVVDSDAESSIGPAIQYVNMEDERETNAFIKPDKPRGVEGTEKLDDSSMINDEVDPVGKLDECVTVTAHSVTDKLTDVVELENLAVQTKLLEVPSKLNSPMTYLSDSGGTGIVVDVKETELYPENRRIVLQSGDTSSSIREGDSSHLTTSENCMQDDLHGAADEKTARLIQDHVEEELLAERAKELVLNKSSETQGRDVKLVGDDGSTYGDRCGRSRYINPADNLRRNRKDTRTTRPRWH
ncbi:exocyst complex component EXO84B isoform X2 [Elaeis guineensis]|uniref:Exocyst complex component EXO84B isoform X2 n=1 Tax=Elaeis guineensis var. tenera TaxID=51953 RepID=A0A8N4F5U3_ELAGV|nr:exocyst complex component EXO84B isoform X2 [Elaeis guineensis]